jgi:hypothetical protein
MLSALCLVRRMLIRQSFTLRFLGHRKKLCFALYWLFLVGIPCGTAQALLKSGGEFRYGISLRVESPESDVEKAVQQIAEDQIIHGTYSYEKEKTLYGAHRAQSSSAFRDSPGQGKVFYKVAENILAPRFFRQSGDIGTITVRYVIQSAGDAATIVQIQAVFVDARHDAHPSEGEVETNEFAAIKQRLDDSQTQKRQAEEAAKEEVRKRAQIEAEKMALTEDAVRKAQSSGADTPVEELSLKVDNLRRQVERRVKNAGTPLKSAPFKSANTIQSLPAHSEVLVMIITPYWYGVETEDGHRGWLHRNNVESLP